MNRSLILKQFLVLIVIAVAVIAGCGGPGECPYCDSPAGGQRQDIAAVQLQAMMNDGQPLVILDVRTAQEYAAGHIPGAINAPLAELDTWANDLCPVCRIVCVCASGNRSRQAADELVSRGFTDVYNLLGGMNAWPGPVE